MNDEVDAIDIADGISARLEYLSCLTETLRDKVGDDSATGTAVGKLSLLKVELDHVLELTEQLSHRLLSRQPRSSRAQGV